MNSSNYLVDLLNKVNSLISEIDKLDSKIRLYKKNCKKFGISYDVQFSISPEYFIRLRDFLTNKIENYYGYDKKIADLRREILKTYSGIISNIKNEISRIDYEQEIQMNEIVYRKIYDSKIENEIKIRDSFNIKSSLFEKILGIKKYRKLAFENHDLKVNLLKQEYEEKRKTKKTIFELVCMIENCSLKTGGLLCLQEDIIKEFMIDRNIIKKEKHNEWKTVMLIPRGFGAKREYYKVLSKNLEKENVELYAKLTNDRSKELTDNNNKSIYLIKLNEKLGKILGRSSKIGVDA